VHNFYNALCVEVQLQNFPWAWQMHAMPCQGHLERPAGGAAPPHTLPPPRAYQRCSFARSRQQQGLQACLRRTGSARRAALLSHALAQVGQPGLARYKFAQWGPALLGSTAALLPFVNMLRAACVVLGIARKARRCQSCHTHLLQAPLAYQASYLWPPVCARTQL